MYKILKSGRGFTLIEIIISVALLSVLSVYLLHLFVQSSNLNRKAYELDRSVVITQNIMELMEQSDTPLIGANPMYTFEWRKSGSGSEKTGILHFDKDFKNVLTEDTSSYVLEISVSEARKEIDGNNLYDISMKMIRVSGLPLYNGEDREIYALASSKFLGSWE
jgi:prepilin-type N-terminal cleavage/methylation domain-containing protein